MPSHVVTHSFLPLNHLQKMGVEKNQGHLGQQRLENNREIILEIYLLCEPALKSYSEACNRDWFWSADLPHPVWKKYWQSILHWLKIIATVPLPCSNLPLDHSRQGHSYIIQTKAREGPQDTGTPEQGTSGFFKDPTFRISDLHCSEKENVCTLSHTQGRDYTGNMWRQSLNYSCSPARSDKHRYSNTHMHTQEQPCPHLSCTPRWKGWNRFLPCGVSELLRQTEQELTTGRSLHAHNAQMGPWTLRHHFLICTQTLLLHHTL